MARTLLLSLFLVSLSSLPIPSHSSTDSFVFGRCTQQKYSPNSPYESNLNSLLTSLVNSATYSSYNNFTIFGSSPQDVIYGLYQCRGDLSMPVCAMCVTRSVSQLGILCSQTCGGAVQLEGCLVKYDSTTFLGVEDKTVVLKKCGPSIGYNADAMSRRDAVLAGLGSAGGPYRVGGSGEEQGVAQCVGDLSLGGCQDCLSEAMGRLKSECGTACYGDMFLAKCYARYTTGGAHVYSKAHHDSSSDNAEKTFPIIIGGLLAGVALLIIYLTFVIKFEGGGCSGFITVFINGVATEVPSGPLDVGGCSGFITVFINGVATEVPRGPLDVRATFGLDVALVYLSGVLLPINDGFLLQSLQHGESYFLVGVCKNPPNPPDPTPSAICDYNGSAGCIEWI